MNKVIRILAASVAAAATAAAAPVLAADGEKSITVSGFGTVGFARTNTNEAQFRTTVFPPTGADKSVDFGVDSKIGMQLNGKVNDVWSGAVQFVSQRTEDSNFTPRVQLAFVKWQPNPNLAVRLGRLGFSVFLATDSLNIGYTNPWLRPPVDVYAQVPMYTIDGIDAIYQTNVGDTTLTFQPMFGNTDFDLPGPMGAPDKVSGKSKDLGGINVVAENGPWTFRAGFIRTNLTVRNSLTTSLFQSLRDAAAMFPAAAELADALEVENKRGQFSGVGAIYNSGRVLVQGEYTKRKTRSFMASTTGAYLTAGYRFGKVMPYVTVADVKVDSPLTNSTLPATGPLAMLAGGVNMVLGTGNNGQHTDSIGVRYDFARNMAFKAQFDHIRLKGDGSTGFFVQPQPGFRGPVNVISAVVDFVF